MLQTTDVALANPVTCPPGGWTCDAVRGELDRLALDARGGFGRRQVGESVDGQPIELVTAGAGEEVVLAWSHMHGDEHTYTGVVLNLLRCLCEGESAWAQRLLKRCTLHVVPMLNPDGTARGWRYNAQGIDINRDARLLSTPEGRVLNSLVTTLRPGYAFNLHNQNCRRRLPGGDGPIAISLLAPPPDEDNTPTPCSITAREIAAEIALTVAPCCSGRVTRYAADYMPRAFGEWVQSSGVATVLLEAGGWEGENLAELEELNLLAFAAGLDAIARGDDRARECAAYDSLPRAAEHEAFDLLLKRANVRHGEGPATPIDLGINSGSVMAMPHVAGDASVVDVGDLSVHSGITELDAEGLMCLPGRTETTSRDQIDGMFSNGLLESAIGRGVTTLVVECELDRPKTSAQVAKLVEGERPLINVCFRPPAANRGAVDVADETADPRWPRGASDLILASAADESDPRLVIVGGTVVARDGEIVSRHAGRWLLYQ